MNPGYLDMNIRLQADFLLDDGTEEPYQSEKLSSLKQDVKLLAAPQQLFSVNFCDMNNIEVEWGQGVFILIRVSY